MNVSLRTCVAGDKVITRDGKTGIYQNMSNDCPKYPHEVLIRYPSGNDLLFHYTDAGHFCSEVWEDHLDIVSVTPKVKTVRQWFELTGAPLKTKLLHNLVCQPSTQNCHVASLYDAIGRGFVWSGTPEGHEYWSNVVDLIYSLKGVPLL
jgi:hypothetical protein